MDSKNDITLICKLEDSAYKFNKIIGRGSFGEVFEAQHKILNIRVAIKRCRKYNAEGFYKELISLEKLRHPHIIQLYHVFAMSIHYYLVMEMAPGCDLFTYLSKRDMKLEENLCRIVGRQLASALCYMHKKQIVHRDMKLENIMVDESTMNIKILDFGLCGILDNGHLLTEYCGTPGYIAPEMYKEQPYDSQIDMWSLGILLYEMLTGILPDIIPFQKRVHKTKIFSKVEEIVKTHLQIEDIKNTSTHFQNLLASLLQADPSKRLNSLRLCQHPWLTESFKKPVTTYGYGSLPTGRRFEIYKKIAQLTNKTIGDTVNLVETRESGHFSGMYRMLRGPELEKLIEKEKKVRDGCYRYSKWRLRLNSI